MTAINAPVACTIVAKNYMAFARTLCDSFLKHHPDGRFYVLFIDDIQGFVNPEEENFSILTLGDIPISEPTKRCFKYDVTELSTAVKPALLRYLLVTLGCGKLLYLDPDILMLSSLSGAYDKLEYSDVLLTPHLLQDFPNDGKLPDDAHIMISGIFNLGFIGVRNSDNTMRFLEWWDEKLKDKCVIEHVRGYFVDQRFVDIASTLFENFEVARELGWNVAYWNLHSRPIKRASEGWTAAGVPLVFFHFSGFDSHTPERLSRFENRFDLKSMPDLRSLLEKYAELLAANGHMVCSQWPYGHGCYHSGAAIWPYDRSQFRAYFAEQFDADPFDIHNHSMRFRIKRRLHRLKLCLTR